MKMLKGASKGGVSFQKLKKGLQLTDGGLAAHSRSFEM
jgi:hypothetical protein